MNSTTNQRKRQHSLLLQDIAGELLGSSWPVSRCLKRPTSSSGVEIRYNGEHARFHGVQTCKSAWTCPICARRIMAARKDEIERIITIAYKRSLSALFFTVTLSHHINSKLSELIEALVSAWRSVFSGDRTGARRVFTRVMEQIKTLEIRFGRNGFHPHLHVLLLVDESGLSELEAAQFEDELAEAVFSRYARKVEKLGMRAEREAYHVRAVSIAGAAAHYVTKLEAALEMTQGESKDGEAGGARSYSMFQLLSAYERGERKVYGREIAALYQEYARATKGKRQVSYSRGIKELGVELREDEQIEEPAAPEERVLALLSPALWRVVCERKARGELLNVADSGSEALVFDWLEAFIDNLKIPIEESAGIAHNQLSIPI